MKLSEAVAEYESLSEKLVGLQEELEATRRRQSVLAKQVFSAVGAGVGSNKGEFDFQVAGGRQYRVTSQEICRINEVEVLSSDLLIGE